MPISRLQIENLRNIARAELEPARQLNLIHGANASGKTTLLESIYLLSRARSFRTARAEEAIRKEASFLRVVAHLEAGDQRHVAGIERQQRNIKVRLDGSDLRSMAEMTRLLPVIEITPTSHDLLERGPGVRRRFVDWGVFHVEHHYGEWWRRFNRALQQRNALLKSGNDRKGELVWRRELAQAAIPVHQSRRAFVAQLQAVAAGYFVTLCGDLSISLEYAPGWDDVRELTEILEQQQERDTRFGFTHQGPHRADLKVMADGHPIMQIASRGQQKAVVFALKLSLVDLFHRHTGQSAILLIDDLPSELDSERRELVLKALLHLDAQLFVSAIDPGQIPLPPGIDSAMFHVKHGQVTPRTK